MRAILTFHSIDPSASVMSVAPEQLRTLVQAIKRSGHEIVSLSEILERPPESRTVALTFDDGFASVHEHALPILRQESAPATLFLTTGHVARDSDWATLPAQAPVFPMLDWAQVEELHAAGWEIEAHTETHPHLPALDDAAMEHELVVAADTIEQRLGRRPGILAYPYGTHDDRTVSATRPHYRFAVTTRMGSLGAEAPDPLRVPRLDVYYFRDSRVHAHFGGPAFRGYLAARALLRRLRGG